MQLFLFYVIHNATVYDISNGYCRSSGRNIPPIITHIYNNNCAVIAHSVLSTSHQFFSRLIGKMFLCTRGRPTTKPLLGEYHEYSLNACLVCRTILPSFRWGALHDWGSRMWKQCQRNQPHSTSHISTGKVSTRLLVLVPMLAFARCSRCDVAACHALKALKENRRLFLSNDNANFKEISISGSELMFNFEWVIIIDYSELRMVRRTAIDSCAHSRFGAHTNND